MNSHEFPHGNAPTRHEATVEGRSATWWEVGQGPCVLLLHGSGIDDSRLSWDPVLAALPGEARLIAPDLPGYGGTARLPRRGGIPEMMRWLRAFLDAVRLPPAIVAGLSMGGAMAIGLALDRPGAVRHLVPVGTYGISDRAPIHRFARVLARSPTHGPGYLAIAASPFLSRRILSGVFADPSKVDAALLAQFRAAARVQAHAPAFPAFVRAEVGAGTFSTDYTPRLPSLRVPTTFVHGRHDRVIPIGFARRAATLVGAELIEAEAGHWPTREAPDAVIGAIRAALAARLNPPAAHARPDGGPGAGTP